MADVNANIGINIDTSQSLAEIKNLQRQLAQLYTSINKGSAAAAAAQKGLATNLMNTINAGGKFYAQMGTIRTSTESFTHALEKNKLTMREYFRFAGGSTRTFGKLFKSEFDTIGRVAEERVKRMQTQYIKLGRDASGAMKAISITPTSLNMKDYGNQVAVAAQKQAILNQLLKQGSTNLLNFGKNTQWAGRQLMVGFTIPLAYFGTAAAKTFMDLEAQALKFRRVYGDMFTTTDETNKALADIEALAKQFTKYGVAVSKTMEMAASAAAMGKTGADLTAQVSEATRLSVLGNVEQQQALDTTISLTNAFGLAAEELASKINFLNSVENQTVVSIEDLTIAIPKAGPVVKQLGGSVEDLAFFLTAMREGGINASEGANALKSGLASLINPTEKASKMLGEMGINIQGIVEANKGDIKKTVIDFAKALDTLAPLERSRAIEQLFGKFQFARLSTLFENVTKTGTQAARVLDLAGQSVEELAILAERELGAVEDAVGTNFKEAVEQLKVAIAPIGKEFLKAITPVAEFLGNLFEKFNNLSDGSKKFIVILTTLVGLVGPTLLMTFGLVANGAANIIKMFILMRQGFLRLAGNSTNLAQQTQYMTTEQQEAAIVAASLNQAHSRLTQQFVLEANAVQQLRGAYVQATSAALRFAAANPGMMIPGFKAPVKKFNKGTRGVPGYSKGTDSVPAMLTPGEAVIPEPIAQDDRFKPLIAALVSGEIKKYEFGTTNVGADGKFTIEGKGGVVHQFTARDQKSAQKIVDVMLKQIGEAQQPGGVGRDRAINTILNRFIDKQKRTQFLVNSEVFKNIKGGQWVSSGSGKQIKSGLARLEKESNLSSAIRNKEVRAVYKALVAEGVTDPKVFKQSLQRQASHLMPVYDDQGKKVASTDPMKWMRGQVVSDMGILNNYLNRASSKEFQRIAYSVIKNPESVSALGLKAQNIQQLEKDLEFARSGRHPINEKQLAAVSRVAQLDQAISKSGLYAGTNLAKTVYQAAGVSALSKVRLPIKGSSVFYKDIIKRVLDLETRKQATELKVGVKAGQKVVDARTGREVAPQRVPMTAQDKAAIPSGQRLNHIKTLLMKRGQAIPPLGATAETGVPPTLSEIGGKTAQQVAAQYRISLNQAKKLVAANERIIATQNKAAAATDTDTKAKMTNTQKMQAGVGALTGLTMAASFAGGSIGEAAQKLLPMVFAIQGITMFADIAKTKMGGLTIALAAVTIAVMKLRGEFDKTRREEIARRKATGTSTEATQGLATFAGKVSAGEIMDRRRRDLNKLVQSAPGKTTFGESFVQSEQGKTTVKAFAEQIAQNKGQLAGSVQDLTAQLSTAVVAGALSPEQARSVAMNVADQLGNMSLGVQVSAKLNELIGPNGENILESPLDVSTRLSAQSRENVALSAKGLSQSSRLVPKTKIGTIGSVAAGAGAGAALGAGLGSIVPVIGTGIGAVIGSVVGAGASYFAQKNASKSFAARSGATIATIGNAMAQQKELQDALDVYYTKKIAEANAENNIAKAKELQLQYDRERNSLAAEGAKLNNQVLNIYKNAGSAQEAILNGVKEQIKLQYKDSSEGMFVGAADDLLKTARKSGGITSEQEALINFKMYSKEILPSQITTLFSMFEGKQQESQAAVNVITKFGGAMGGEMTGVLGLLVDKQGKPNTELQSRFILAMEAAPSSAEAKELLDFTREVGKLGGIVDADFHIKFFMDNPKLAEELKKIIGDVDATKDITVDLAYKINPILKDDPQQINDAFDEKYFETLKDEATQKVYTKTVSVLAKMSPSTIVEGDDYKKWLKEWDAKTGYGGADPSLQGKSQGFLVNEYIKDQGFKATQAGAVDATATPTPTPTPSSGGTRDTTLDPLLKRLKFTADARINAQGGIPELLKITKGKGVTKFQGVAQQLLTGLGGGGKGGFNREFISMLEDMDNKTRDKFIKIAKNGEVILKPAGKALKEALNEKTIRDFSVAQLQSVQDSKAQAAALVKLKAAGVDSATALELVSDANMAVAINGKSITTKELQQMAADAKAAKDEMEKLNIEVLTLAEGLKKDVGDAVKTNQALLKAREAGIVDPEMLDYISKNASLVNKILQEGTGSETAQSIMQSVNAMKALGEQTAALVNPAQAALDKFSKLKDAAFEAFDIQQRQAQSKFNAGMNKTVSSFASLNKVGTQFQGMSLKSAIKSAEGNIAGINNQIKAIQDGQIRPIEVKIEAKQRSIDDIMKSLETQAAGMSKGFKLPAAAYKDIAQGLQDQIQGLELDIEFNFKRPIDELQEESSDLSNELTLMDRVIDGINKKYDAQAEALQKVSDVNQEILGQQKSQLDIASAITQGDIAAAARAAQDARAQAAASAAKRAGGVLDAARQAEVGAVRSAGGMTREQIEQRQFQISQQIFQLEEQSEVKQRAILALKDQIDAGERAREAFIRETVLPLEREIEGLQASKQVHIDNIAKLEADILRIQYEVLGPLQAEADILQQEYDNAIDLIDQEKQHWLDQETALIIATKETTKFAGEADKVKTAFENAKKVYDDIKNKTVTITVQYVYVGTPPSGSTSSTSTTSTTKKDDPKRFTGGLMYGGRVNGYMGGGRVKPIYRPMGGLIPYMNNGGFKPMGSDTVPAMLTPGEYVVNKSSTKAFLPLLTAMNESKFPSSLTKRLFNSAGDVRITRSFNTPNYNLSALSNTQFLQPSYDVNSNTLMNNPISNNISSYSDNSSAVYNYNVGISVGGTDASPDTIAKAVMREIKYIDSQRIRSQRTA